MLRWSLKIWGLLPRCSPVLACWADAALDDGVQKRSHHSGWPMPWTLLFRLMSLLFGELMKSILFPSLMTWT